MLQRKAAHQDLGIFALRKNRPWTASPMQLTWGSSDTLNVTLARGLRKDFSERKTRKKLELIHY